MGTEYSIKFKATALPKVEGILGHLAPFDRITRDEFGFHLWMNSPTDGMPDATTKLEPGGLYFIHHGGSGREFLGRLVSALVSEFGVVTVQDYE
jgi:hypothetical protein